MAEVTVMAPVHPGEILLEEFLKPLASEPVPSWPSRIEDAGPADQ